MSKNIISVNNQGAYISYEIINDIIIVNKTFVAPEHRGQNLGRKLYVELIKLVRSSGTKFKSNCSYITKLANEDKSVQDIYIK